MSCEELRYSDVSRGRETFEDDKTVSQICLANGGFSWKCQCYEGKHEVLGKQLKEVSNTRLTCPSNPKSFFLPLYGKLDFDKGQEDLLGHIGQESRGQLERR